MASAKAARAAPARPDYGIDAPGVVKKMFVRGSVILAIGLLLFFVNDSTYPHAAASLLAALGAIGAAYLLAGGVMIWSSKTAKLGVRDRLLDAIPWRGDEKVLDVGCGRGLLLIGAARRIKSGKATGVDIWSAADLSGNHPDNTLSNAKAEGVADRVKLDEADARKLPAGAGTCDVVVSSLAIHNIPGAEERKKALAEILRVTKPGGHIAIFDIVHTGAYEKYLAGHGCEPVARSGLSFLWCMPTRWFVVRKK
ncbi:MAG: class I SAM-dependent methyltransferase [Bryobacteraceae bacterium]